MKRVAFAVALVLATPAVLSAQKPLELGVDAELRYTNSDPSITSLTFPNGSFRVGIPAGEHLVVEPRVTFQYGHSQGNTVTFIDLQIGVPWMVTPDRTRSSVYVRPFVNLFHVAGALDATQFGLGGALGVRLPGGDRIAFRLEAGYRHNLATDSFQGLDIVFGLLGISFFTH